MFEEGQWVIYHMISKDEYGFIENGQFNTIKRFIKEKEPLLVQQQDLSAWGLSLEKEDYEELIDMALYMGDKRWFQELLQRQTDMVKGLLIEITCD